MGYIYTQGNSGRWRLTCDHCGVFEKVSKIPCPYGYCPPPALCPTCAKLTKARHKANHQRCKVYAAEFDAQQKRRKDLMAAGYFIRWSAIGENGQVKVSFRCGDEVKDYMMAKEVYRSIPLGVVATVDDYACFGNVTVI